MATNVSIMENEKVGTLYPIAEVFTSPQGEGVYAGQMQTFIRLAGCTVGKRYPEKMYKGDSRDGLGLNKVASPDPLPIYTEQCTLYDDRKFPCDTDYRVHERMSAHQIVERIPANVDDVCITGGEPLMHNLSTLFTYILGVGRRIHIETSGSINVHLHNDIWVTMSPKRGIKSDMLRRANELKILVDENFDPEVPITCDESAHYLETLAHQKPVFLQPINFEKTVNAANLKLCRQWQDKYPMFRISPQMHKMMSHFLNEEVR